jgi:hypothetical protein
MKKYLHWTIVLLILINIYFAAWLPLHGDLTLFPDNARDLLLMEDVANNKPITLIGPHSGGIPGLFHGPLWTYINMPAYLLGKGNPAYVGIFWVILYVLTIFFVYLVGKKLFDKTVGLLSSLLFSAIFMSFVPGFGNPYGSVLLFPVFFYYFVIYLKEYKVKFLLISLFILGLIIQFQMAFGVPILAVVLIFLVINLYNNKKLFHLFSFFILLVPLSTFIIFDIRHNFLQLHSLINYIISRNIEKTSFFDMYFLTHRIPLIFTDGLSLITRGQWWLTSILIIYFLYIYWRVIKSKKIFYKKIYFISALLYIGFWVVTLLYKGQMWLYYHWQMIPMLIIVICSGYLAISKKVFATVFCIFYLFIMFSQITWIKGIQNDFIGKDRVSWVFFRNAIDDIYKENSSPFGYYIFEDDLLGYRGLYTFHYLQQFHKNVQAVSNTKKQNTYLIVISEHNQSWWKANQIRISSSPAYKKIFKNNYEVEKYILSNADQQIPSDPNLTDNLFFR